MAQKEYLKMADVFKGIVFHYGNARFLADDDGYLGEFSERNLTIYAAHAINSHDELAAEVELLRGALTSSRLALSNAAMNMKWFDISKAQEILREVNSIDKLISAIGTSDAKI